MGRSRGLNLSIEGRFVLPLFSLPRILTIREEDFQTSNAMFF